MATAVLLDGDLKSALAAGRALGSAGRVVVVGAERYTAMSMGSRYVTGRFVYPSPQTDPEQFLSVLTAELNKIKTTTGQPAVVFTFSDATTTLLLQHFARFRDILLFPHPEEDAVAVAFDKHATARCAERLEIPTIPELWYDQRADFDYPVVIKPRHSISWHDKQGVTGTAEFVFSVSELEARYETWLREAGEAPLLQPLVYGEEFGVELLAKQGQVLQSFTHKRIRSLSPRGGAAVVKETAAETEATKTMNTYAQRIVEKLQWTGPIMVEFKVDSKINTVRLMELNGRFWGSLPLPLSAGVDFANGYYALATGGAEPEPGAPAPYRRTYHLLGDIRWLLSVLFAKDRLRPQLYPSRFAALRDFSLELVRGRSDVFWFSDPLPTYFEIIDVIKR